MSKQYELKNYDNNILPSIKHNLDVLPNKPIRLLITGQSGCGKTNLLLNFVHDLLNFDNLFICAKSIEEDKY